MPGVPLANRKEWKLTEQQELRIEVGKDEQFQVTLMSGSAEVFGVELVASIPYMFSNTNVCKEVTFYK